MIGISQFPLIAMKNRQIIEQSNNVGCFHCVKIYPKQDIKEYTDKGQTVICPLCEVDSVVGDMCGFELTEDIIKKANEYWYPKSN